ncbi:MAG TPA: FkbM family methyltransferase [Burkholderiales bacterium]|nr:FkbM family methyltransferase [Burkholderiales bacterium]
MSVKRKAFEAISDLAIGALALNRPLRVWRAFLARVNAVKRVSIRGTTMLFDANEELHLLRAEWLETKEPETLAWIDSFAPSDVFYDIGANVGVFSVYAALRRNCDVYAFEPEAKNYACLAKNLYLNGLGRRVKALNLGLHDRSAIEFLQLHGMESGAALHALGEPVDWRKQRFEPKFEQSVVAYALDELIERFAIPLPSHIKLDVDGNEPKIVAGGKRTFANPALRSLLIEMNEHDRALIGLLESCGLRLDSRTRTATASRYQDTYNAVFRRA